MNATIAAWIAVGINAILAIYLYGGVVEKVKNLEKRADTNDTEQAQQWDKLGLHSSEIGYIKGRLNGKSHGAHG